MAERERNISPREQLEAAGSPRARRIMQGRIQSGINQRRRRNLEGGLRSLALHNYNEYDRGNPYLKDKLFADPTYTGVSWPGGRERYLSRINPLNTEALYRQNKEIYPPWMIDYYGGEENIPETSGPSTIYLGNPYRPNYEGYDSAGGYEPFKEGMPVEGWNEFELDRQREEFPFGEFSGTEFPPRPIEDDPTLPDFLTRGTGRDSSALPPMITPGTGRDSSALPDFLTPGTGNRPYDGTPSGVGEFVDENEDELTYLEKLFGF